MHTVIELPQFIRRAKACGVTDDERTAMIDFIAATPQCGDEMPENEVVIGLSPFTVG